ncbi:alkaline phosphatase PafA [Jiulongibacter sediminis]|uniref:alkaline phosphatase PafA n=1 Tax=Jiulongibacter sediminis TaxID=1605367 RepID=UPI0026EE49E1|nr:alkaline phosphatase PafA [Jiulongibacter sediminis]
MNRLLTLVALVSLNSCFAQPKNSSLVQKNAENKLVVGIVVDQMRYEYLNRFADRYSEGGFKRLMSQGFNCKNNHYHYASTVTGPGHAHVYSGSVPAVSGIVGNEWFEKISGQGMYVASDSTASVVGEGSDRAGKMSPKNLKVTSITDQLRMATQFGSKVIGVAIKDRGAIMPAGHTGTAYWFDSSTGNWISSTHYMDVLPEWATKFNNADKAEAYASLTWNTLYDIETYTASEEDDQPYENTISGETKAVFPHSIKLGSLASTPWGNTLTLDFALEAMKSENLGRGKYTDFLAISFSSPDYAGHAFGPQSVEIEDIYLRLDQEIARLLNELDAQVGEGNYTVFLTADHAVADIPAYLMKNKIPGGLFIGREFQNKVEALLDQEFGDGDWIRAVDNYQIYLNRNLMSEKDVDLEDVFEYLQPILTLEEGVYNLVNLAEGELGGVPPFYQSLLQNLYNPKRTGELMILVEPGWFHGYNKGTTHGTMWAYDTHVPLLWYGYGIANGETVKPTYISDIAATLSQLLGIQEPNGSVGKPIEEVLK